jgi:hypothetical protein
LSSSKFEACWLLGTGLISLALIPVPVEEQPVARTTIIPRATASNGARLTWSHKAYCEPNKYPSCFAISPGVQAINSSSNALFLESFLLHFSAPGSQWRKPYCCFWRARSYRKSGEANGTHPSRLRHAACKQPSPRAASSAKVSRVVRLPPSSYD